MPAAASSATQTAAPSAPATETSAPAPDGVTAPPLPPLPTTAEQLDRLLALGVAELAGVDPQVLRDAVAALAPTAEGAQPLLAIHPTLLPARTLAPLLVRADRPGFVVDDWTDLEEFVTVPGLDLPDSPLYLVHAPDRGDDLRNASPEEARTALTARGRSPFTLHEGISWLLQTPDALVPNHCFMLLSTRRPKPRQTFDARTAALWISGGTGRDGRERRGAVKVGWCWWRNRHTWLGFASTAARSV